VTELGNRLKEARLAKGLSLDDLQSMTKIQKRYLIGIEEGNYSSMPGNFYVRAFIKQYAEALQLNPDEIFDKYKGEIPASYHDELPEQLSRVKTRNSITEGHSKLFDILPKILIAIFVLGAAGLLYYFLLNHAGSNSNESINKNTDSAKIVQSESYQKANDKASQTKDSGNDKKGTSKAEKTTPPADITPKQELSLIGSSGINSSYSLKNADKFEVKLVSKGQTWVNVKNKQGKSYFQGLLSTAATSTQTVDLSAESEVTLVVGRTVDTDIYVNDQKLEYAIAPTDVVRQNITIQYVPKNK
jgi:cytoskeletal protein RodZ